MPGTMDSGKPAESTMTIESLSHIIRGCQLLDWSHSFYVAAFFAYSTSSRDTDVAIWAFKEWDGHHRTQNFGDPMITTIGSYIETHPGSPVPEPSSSQPRHSANLHACRCRPRPSSPIHGSCGTSSDTLQNTNSAPMSGRNSWITLISSPRSRRNARPHSRSLGGPIRKSRFPSNI